MKSQWQHVRSQWQENPRLRFVGIAIVVISLACLVSWLDDLNVQLSQEVQRQQRRQVRLEALARQRDWPKRVVEAQGQRTQLEAHLWQAETLGLAQAAVQSWLTQQLTPLNLTGLQVDVGQPEALASGFDDLWRVPIQLQGQISRHQMVRLLNTIEYNQKLTNVQFFHFLSVGDGLRINLQLQAFFVIVGEVSS